MMSYDYWPHESIWQFAKFNEETTQNNLAITVAYFHFVWSASMGNVSHCLVNFEMNIFYTL